MSNVFYKPALDADGKPLLVRDPLTMKPLDEAGEWKTQSPFWIRRVRDKEVTDATPSSAAVLASAPAPAVEPSAGTSLLNLINPTG